MPLSSAEERAYLVSNSQRWSQASFSLRPILEVRGYATRLPEHDLLRIPADASEEEVKRAFRERAKQTHPDVARTPHVEGGNSDETFAALVQAYEKCLAIAQGKLSSSGSHTSAAPMNDGPLMAARRNAAARWRMKKAQAHAEAHSQERAAPRHARQGAAPASQLQSLSRVRLTRATLVVGVAFSAALAGFGLSRNQLKAQLEP
ncbi:hypothetical protein PPROV_000742400 [Pycnococcus provasolii]|uniref:J domain-containing protein n=1 Tax=Pycnococcus provasolii TaxID=41880 RepID=A0A830HUS5_9CHLO|nr:hypothetical protein PPROV_000742400 [Pycnococcus provasolii]